MSIVIDREIEAAFAGRGFRELFADEEDGSGGAEAADESAERLSIPEVGLVGGAAGDLESIGIGGPAVGFPGEAGEAAGGDLKARGLRQRDAGIEIFDLGRVADRVGVNAAGDGALTHSEAADLLDSDFLTTRLEGHAHGFKTAAEGFAGGEANEAQGAVEAIGVAGDDAFEEAI